MSPALLQPTERGGAAGVNCPRCSTPLPEHSRYCLSCGASISGAGDRTADFDVGLQARLQEDLGSEYTIEKELGRGGMAAVFLAHDQRLGRKVAVKVLPPELSFGQPGVVERFRREARTAATLDHPHIIPIYRVSGEGRLVWYVMKYLQGESVDRLLQRVWRLSVDATVRIIEQVAAALQHAHEAGVVHRDVKPANAVIDPKGWVTVTDFGIAKAIEGGDITATGSTIGTPFYMSPEQCAGNPITGAADQYALGVMTYQMLGGRVPFTGQSVVDIIRRHCFDVVPSLAELRPELTTPVIEVVERALAKKPDERFPSVTSFATALDLAAKGVDVGASYPVRGDAMHAADTVIVNQPVKDRRKHPRIPGAPVPLPAQVAVGPRRIRAWAGAGLAVAGLAAVAVLQPWRNGAAPPPLDSAANRPQQVAVVPADTAAPDTTPARAATDTTSRNPAPRPRREPRVVPSSTTSRPPAPASGPAWISVGSRPNAPIRVNGGPELGNPLINYQVPSGWVRLTFLLSDNATGVSTPWDTLVTIAPGDTLNLRILTLRRP